MHEDRIEISSPGGLPAGITKEEYLSGNISVLRNPTIAGVFGRLNLIEKFGTGITRINDEYSNSISKPGFYVSENRIRIVLPLTKSDKLDFSGDELIIYDLLKDSLELSRKDLDLKTGFDKAKTLRILNSFADRNIVKKMAEEPL